MDLLYILETDKAAFEVEAEQGGHLSKIISGNDTEVKPLDVVGIIHG